MTVSGHRSTRPAAVAASGLLLSILLLGCGTSAGSQVPSTPAATLGGEQASPTEPAPTQADGGAASDPGGGPIGGDIGDRSKGSVQAQVTGGLTSTIDLPFGAAAARLLLDGPGTAYLPFTDPANGTLFLTIGDSGLLVQYAGPGDVALTNGAQPCELHLDSLDAGGAKGTFSCKGLLLVKPDAMGSADMTGTFEGHP